MTTKQTLRLPGRVLFLAADPERITAQLGGADLDRAAAGPLRDEISTDEITPLTSVVYFDQRLGDHAYVGVKAGEALPIGVGAVRAGGFSVTVAGGRYGKGSSREHSPLAEKLAGIRLVVAESFERIYRQNADNLGLFTSTDFGLIDRIRRGEAIEVEELVAGRDALAAAVLREGGLLRYGRTRLRAATPVATAAPGPRTLAHKILARHVVATPDASAVVEPGRGVFVRADIRFIHDIYTAMCRFMLARRLRRGSGAARPQLDPDLRGPLLLRPPQRGAPAARACCPRCANSPPRTGPSSRSTGCATTATCLRARGRRASRTP